MNKKNLSILIILIVVFIISFIFFQEKIPKNTEEQSINLSSLIAKTKSEIRTGHKIQIQIQNGCGLSGIAKVYTNFLRSNGYDVIEYKNAPHFEYKNTQLIIHKKDTSDFIDEMIQTLQIKPNFITYNYDNKIIYEMTVIIGHDYNNLDSYNEVTMHYEPF